MPLFARNRTTTGLSPFFFVSNFLIWVSAVIVMGILAFFFSKNKDQAGHVIYELVISVLTVAFFLASFFLGAFAGFHLLFNVIFSYLWLVIVVFTALDWTNSGNALGETIEAFSFIAFFLLFFNVLFEWHLGYRVGGRHTSAV